MTERLWSELKDSPQVTTFSIGRETFGVPICRIREIVRYPELTTVPRVEKYILGLANLRGDVLPVVDGRLRLGLEKKSPGERTRVLVLDLDGRKLGLVVDQVLGVVNSADMQVDPAPELLSSGVSKEYIGAVLKDKERSGLVMLLDLDNLCVLPADPVQNSADSLLEQMEGQKEDQAVVEEDLLVSFVTAGEEYALPIAAVHEVIKLDELTAVPDVPDYILGLISVRDEFLPLVDFRRISHLPSLLDDINFLLDLRAKKHTDLFVRVRKALENGGLEKGLDLTVKRCPLVSWLREFHTSSEEVNLAAARILMVDRALHGWAADMLTKEDLELSAVCNVLEDRLGSLEQALADFRTILAREIHEDQRVLVIALGGLKVGLVVDRMSQVLRVPRQAVTDPPRLLNREGSQSLAGIVRLEQGERIILLLAVDRLLDLQLLEQIKDIKGEEASLDRQESSYMGDEVQLVTFVLGEEEFALPIEDVQEINRLSTLTQVPRTPEFVEGVMNVRGNVIPAIDLRKKFLWPHREYDEATKVIIVHLEGQLTGLIVDGVSEVLRVARQSIEPAPDLIGFSLESRFLKGVVKLKERQKMIMLIELDQILSLEEKEQLHQAASSHIPGSGSSVDSSGLEGNVECADGSISDPALSPLESGQADLQTGDQESSKGTSSAAGDAILPAAKTQGRPEKPLGLKKKGLKGRLKKAR